MSDKVSEVNETFFDNSPEARDARNKQHLAKQAACDHDWTEYWDGSLGYGRTDQCVRCHAYRPTPRA